MQRARDARGTTGAALAGGVTRTDRPVHSGTAATRLRRARTDRGQVAIEYVGLVPVLIVIALIVIQGGIAIFTVQQAGGAARAAARAAAESHHDATYAQAGRDATSDFLRDGATFKADKWTRDEVTITASIEVPTLIPGLGLGKANRSVTMPRD